MQSKTKKTDDVNHRKSKFYSYLWKVYGKKRLLFEPDGKVFYVETGGRYADKKHIATLHYNPV